MNKKNMRHVFLIFLLVLSSFVSPVFSSSWLTREPTPIACGYGEAVAGTGDKVYVIRSYSSGQASLRKYNPTLDTWTTIIEWTPDTPAPRPKGGTGIAWNQDDYLYILLGAAYADTGRRYFYRYKISDETWQRLADTPIDQGPGNAIVYSGYDNQIYALIGSRSHGSGFAVYDPTGDSWDTLNLEWASVDDGSSLAWTGSKHIFAL